jgi:GT2 family glycosyltransferase
LKTVSAYILHCLSENSDELLEETYRTLKASDYPALEITIVENGLWLSGYESVRRIHSPVNLGVAGGYNKAIDSFLGTGRDYILLANNDIRTDKRMVSELVSTIETFSDCGIVSPRIFYYGTNRIWFNGGAFNAYTGVSRHIDIRKLGPADTKEKETDYATFCCALISREVIERVGALNEEVSPYGEDLEYSLRAKAEGFKIYLNPKAVMSHKISSSSGLL